MRRKFIIGAMALAMPLGMVATLGAGSATASSNATGTGTYSCKVLTGTITFSPPLTNTAKIETTTVKAVAKTCSGTAKPTPLSATSSSKTTGTKPSSCTTLVSATTAVKFATTYSPVVTPSTFTGSAKGGTAGSSAVFNVTGKVTGSYPSALAKAHAVIKESISTILGLCRSTGVATLHIASGTVTTN
jgi:hypothetical protein